MPGRRTPNRLTAHRVLSLGQLILLAIIVSAVGFGLVRNNHKAVIGLIAAAMVFWTVFVSFRLFLWAVARSYRYPQVATVQVTDPDLPTYSIFVPLLREGDMLPRLVEAIDRLEYPKNKLQVLLLLEADDEDTSVALSSIKLPGYFEPIQLPPIPKGKPQTKPNALNFGLHFARGEMCVIYDAEDRPEPDQLLKAVATLRASPPDVVCLQARLAFWNQTTNWITRFYGAEYVTHFEWVLAGLAKLNLVPPLGGTSNHFITQRLREVAIDTGYLPFRKHYTGGWDPYNVTEDAELAGALACHGYRVAMLDSVTWEEATASLRVADKQRRRWLKGYTQTGLVYTRNPLRKAQSMGFTKWFVYNLIMLGTPLSLLLNPIFWTATAVYFATRTTVIEQLFPLPLYYLGLMLMVVGNLVLFYQMVAACLRRESFGSVKYMLLVPVWWFFTSWSAYAMVLELILRPHYWHKTKHGHDLRKEELLLPQRGSSVDGRPTLAAEPSDGLSG